VLWVIAEVEGRPNGRTYLQKMCFFVGRILALDLGYRAHHYGPYSDFVSAEISFLVANGYAFESAKRFGMADGHGWEIARRDYELTERGKQGVLWLDGKHSEEARQVRAAIERVKLAGDLNYVGLSFAAKTYWILSHAGVPMTPERIRDKAKELRWQVETKDIASAADFLQRLNLATVAAQ
jgi:hypothetical protein